MPARRPPASIRRLLKFGLQHVNKIVGLPSNHVMHPMASTAVSEFIWTQLETAFQDALRHLIKDIATTLGQSQDPLRQAFNNKISIHLIENECESVMQHCTYMCSHADTPAFLSECGEPILWTVVEQQTHRCPRHLGLAPAVKPTLILTPLTSGYAYAEDGTVYNGQGEACGFYADKVLTVFETETV